MGGQAAPSNTALMSAMLVALAVAALLLVAIARPALAVGSLITVNTPDDEITSDGDCSLREAVLAANIDVELDACPTGSGNDTIIVPASATPYTLTKVGKTRTMASRGIWTCLTWTG